MLILIPLLRGKPTVDMDDFVSDSGLSQFRSPDATFGNLDASATWRRILVAINELSRGEVGEGEAVH